MIFTLILTVLAVTVTAVNYVPSTLNVTVLNAKNNLSTLECWSLKPGFITSQEAGVQGSGVLSLGEIGSGLNASYLVIPPGFDGGKHNAPTTQWVVFLSGFAHITLPHHDDEAYVIGGDHGMILALDTAAVSAEGHYTTYPGGDVTTALELPIREDEIPDHEVLHKGACNAVRSK